MTGKYNPLLVITSIAIALLASWVALDFTGRVHTHAQRSSKTFWLVLGSLAMGIGIWSMHYVGMVAYSTGMPVLYDWPTVLLSMLAAVLASFVAMALAARKNLSGWETIVGGVVMGGAIASMHYIGMAAIRMPMSFTYDGPLVWLSVVAAVAISMVGLRLTFQAKEILLGWSGRKALSAGVMGLAIPSMHYIGMAAMRMSDERHPLGATALRHAVAVNTLGIVGIGLTSALVLVAALVVASIDRHVVGFVSALDGSTRNYHQLKRHHELLQGAFRAGGFGIWECDPATGLFYVDESLRDLYGIPHDGMPIPRNVWRAKVDPRDVERLDRRWAECLAAGDRYENEYRIVPAQGMTRQVRSIASLIRNEDGSIKRVLGMTWDVTYERQREQESRDQAARFRLTLEAIGDAVLATDENACVVFLNPVASKLTGWSAAEAVGRQLSEVFCVQDEHTGELNLDPTERCLASDGCSLSRNSVLLGPAGRRYNIREHTALTGQGRAAVITFQDITDARRLENELTYAANHDALTGLPNRAAFEKALQALWEDNRYNGRVHSLCILDLDRFKVINDASGHIAGDALLKKLGQMLRQKLSSRDMVARMGGDEFMLLLLDMPADEAVQRMQALVADIAELHFQWKGRTYDITASLGLVSFDCFSPEPESLLSQADAAAFTAKRNGRNQVALYVQESDVGNAYNEMKVAADLKRCIEENCFELHAQPIVPTVDPVDAGYFEILVRMRGLDGELISPALFIPAAERFGMMGMVDRWVIRTALNAYSLQDARASGIRLAINVSAQSLSDPTFWGFVSEQFLVTAVNPANITFEVTETGIIENLEVAKDFMRRCRQLGSRIALDDFGTGLSSLSYLKQFPLDVIKIDGGFVRSLLHNPLDQAIVRSVGEIARSVGATTVAECVEDIATIHRLQELKVDWVQGWATGRPVPLEQVLSAIKDQSPHPVRASLAGQAGFLLGKFSQAS